MGFEMLHAWYRVSGSAGLFGVEIVCVMISEEVRTAIEMLGVPSCWRAEEVVLFGNCEAIRSSRAVKNGEDGDEGAIALATARFAAKPSEALEVLLNGLV